MTTRSPEARALEALRIALDAAHTAAVVADAEDIRDYLADLVSDCAVLIADDEEAQEPCTDAARARGCSCRMQTVYATMIDPPEPIVDKFCPLHGGCDPDAAYEKWRDKQMERS
jgi:hypothetical protein